MERGVLLVLRPFQNAVTQAINRFQHIWEDYLALLSLRKENQQLRAEVEKLRAEKNRYIERAKAYDRLKETLNLVEEREFSTILARVIGFDSTNQTNTVIINKGTQDGVRESWPVITQDGIVGITLGVSRNVSKVLLLMDPNCNVAALVQRTRDQGIVGGQSKKEAYSMKYVNRRANIREGTIYELTDPALRELAKEGLPGFRLTTRAFFDLQEAGIPPDLLIVLQELKDLLYVSRQSFIRALENTIGPEQTRWYQETIVAHTTADLLARLRALRGQKFHTKDEFLKALEATIGQERTLQYQKTIINYAQHKETVVSSGLGGIFPKGLLIGTVSKVVKHDYGLFQDIQITPSVDFSKLEEVLIIRRDDPETEEKSS